MRRLNQIFGSGADDASAASRETRTITGDTTSGSLDANYDEFDTAYSDEFEVGAVDSPVSDPYEQLETPTSSAPPWQKNAGAEKRAKSQNLKRLRKKVGFGALAFSSVFVVVAGFWALTTGRLDVAKFKIQNSAEASLGSFGLTLHEFVLQGQRQYTTKVQIAESLNASRGEPILAVDPSTLRQRLLTLPWVKEVMVERVLPNRVIVTLEEHKPLAVWQFQGQQKLLNQQGLVIEVADLEPFNKLPIVVGNGADLQAPKFFTMLAKVNRLASKLQVAQFVNGRRWTLKLNNGVLIHLPEDDALVALNRVAILDKTDSLLSRDVLEIDLRLADRMVVRTNSGADVENIAPAGASPILGEQT